MTTLESGAARRPFLISKAWLQAVLLVVLAGFFVLALLAYRALHRVPRDPPHRRARDGRGAGRDPVTEVHEPEGIEGMDAGEAAAARLT